MLKFAVMKLNIFKFNFFSAELNFLIGMQTGKLHVVEIAREIKKYLNANFIHFVKIASY